MEKVINIYKTISLTPLQVVNGFKEQFPEYTESKISYAGRLDPLAEGVLILLVDEENKNREKYQKLDKEYEFEVLFGAATDTYDVLGIINNETPKRVQPAPGGLNPIGINEAKIKQFATSLIGMRSQPYPPFSSFQIQKKPLFQWAKEGRLDEIKIPTKEIEIYDIKHLGTYEIGSEELHRLIIERVSKVQGKFRQKEILKRWDMFFEKENWRGKESDSSQSEESDSLLDSGELLNFPPLDFPIMKFRIHCGSGTYVRQIAHEMGQTASTGALALSIKRTRVGEYTLEKSLKL